ncbi:MAG: hypothetical protein IRZ29_07610 [Thermoflavifilum sp.]|nr:hypothetical protein [Thermoflavifilum sp.]
MFSKPSSCCALAMAGLLLSLGACHKTSLSPPPDAGYAFFPIYVGMERHYWLDSIIYRDFDGTIDTEHYEAWDRVDTSYLNDSGQQVFRILRMLRPVGIQQWLPALTIEITWLPQRMEWLEDNLRYIKLIFPVAEGKSWSGNAYLETNLNPDLQYLNGWVYAYQDVNKPANIDTLHFDSTLTVREANDSLNSPSYAFRTYSLEQYARGVGLVYRHFIHWEQQCASYDPQGNCQALKPRKGIEVRLWLKDTL